MRDALSSMNPPFTITAGGATVKPKAIDGVIHLDAVDGQKLSGAYAQVLADLLQQPVLSDGTTHRPRAVFELRAPMLRPFGPFQRFYLGMLFNGRQMLPRQYVKLEDALDQLIEGGAKENGVVFVNQKVGGKMPIDLIDAEAFYILANQLGVPVSFKNSVVDVKETTYHPET